MEEFVAYIIKNLVTVPEEVSVTTREEGEKLMIEVHVSSEDVGKIIGRKGNTINALRTIVRTVATRVGRKVQVELIQPEKREPVATEEAEPEEVIAAAEEIVAEESAATEEVVVEESATEEVAVS